ncbi:MAG TPA: Gfo/Idh/MocA family oxidoreductase [Planctomycetaceae bacterium]|jgi:predicted dehydrogenase|nr:Gfo/Idh/MocA family oxidoreductase [Planctomycetaceae bacterium]
MKDANVIGVAVVGCGYWGPNLLRNFSACPATHVVAACDKDSSRLDRVESICPTARLTANYDEILRNPHVDAVAIATPVATHVGVATAALEAGKHVLVEKPLAGNVRDAEHLVQRAREAGRILMVDHTYLYSPTVRKIKELVDKGDFGEIFYIDSVRINLGQFQSDINVLWDLAPHDLSIIDYLLGRMPRSLSAMGVSHTSSDLEDVAYLNLDFGQSLMATFHVNWLSPVKLRHTIIGGSKRSLVYNDLDPVQPIQIYDSGIQLGQSSEARYGALVSYRMGDIWSPYVSRSEEPLQNVVRHFAECILENKPPLTDGEAGLRVVRILEAAQRSIKAQGGRITL